MEFTELNCKWAHGIYPGELQSNSENLLRCGCFRRAVPGCLGSRQWAFPDPENTGIYLYDFCKPGFTFEVWPSSSGDGRSSVAMFCGCSVGIKINPFHQLCSVGPLLTTPASSALERRVKSTRCLWAQRVSCWLKKGNNL